MTAPTPWQLAATWDRDKGPFVLDANDNLVDVRRDGNGELIVEAVNKLMKERAEHRT